MIIRTGLKGVNDTKTNERFICDYLWQKSPTDPNLFISIQSNIQFLNLSEFLYPFLLT